eukprot:TRINITY_DN5382_c0_g1_i1.p1 TRINITY_DN5382_c0_g1~~TRINITY_DN5382_c0_g1_i1.p1  ORF type:complete len:414 (-),score=82.62 TRINITY_DN5382_c0_g1_i1:4-1218(-)
MNFNNPTLETVLFIIHQRIINKYLNSTTTTFRICFELTFLFFAFFFLFLLVYLHLTYVGKETNCFVGLSDNYPYNNNSDWHILEINIVTRWGLLQKKLNDKKQFQSKQLDISVEDKLDSIDNFNIIFNELDLDWEDPSFLFSYHQAYLLLPQKLREIHNVFVKKIEIESTNICFGNKFSQFLLENFVGYDTVIIQKLISISKGRGYLKNVQTKETYYLYHQSEHRDTNEDLQSFIIFKLSILIGSILTFYFVSAVAAILIRETQMRIFDLSIDLVSLFFFHRRNPIPNLLVNYIFRFLVLTLSTLGATVIVYGFFEDKNIAFTNLLLMCLLEMFILISARTRITSKLLPQFIFLYIVLFFIYYFNFPFGFHYLAWLTTTIFSIYTLLFFFHNFELQSDIRQRIR